MPSSTPVALPLLIATLTLTACGGGSSSSDAAPETNTPETTEPAPTSPTGNILLRSTSITAGEQCPAGGTRVDTGLDSNNNGVLDDQEVTETQYICNGLNGQNGKDGPNGADGKTTQLPIISNSQANEDSAQITFTLSLPEPATESMTVTWGTVDVTAESGEDYRASAGELVFAVGDQNKQIQIELIDDDRYECSEYFMLQANSPLGSSAGFGRIDYDGNEKPQLNFSQATMAVNENAGNAMVQVELQEASCIDNQITVSHSQVTALSPYAEHAQADSDFTITNSFTIPAGQTSANFDITIIDDSDKELRESLMINLSSNGQIQMPDNAMQLDIMPVTARVFGGYYSSCALSQDNLLKCWGYGDDYNFATGESQEYGTNYGEAALVSSCNSGSQKGLFAITKIANDNSACSQLLGGVKYARGLDSNNDGTLADSEQTSSRTYCNTSTRTYIYREEALQPDPFVCDEGGSGFYIGEDENNDGELQIVEMGAHLPPALIGDEQLLDLTLGEDFSCGLFSGGDQPSDNIVKCWGDDDYTGLERDNGNSSVTGDELAELGNALPAVQLGTDRYATAIAGGDDHTCVLLDNGRIKCWGDASNGQLGYGDTTDRGDNTGSMGDNLPYVDLGTDSEGQPLLAKSISAGYTSSCAVLTDGRAKCWGRNISSILGINDDESYRGRSTFDMGNNLPFVELNNDLAKQIEIGYRHACAILSDGRARCWGRNTDGQVGLGLGDSTITSTAFERRETLCADQNLLGRVNIIDPSDPATSCDQGGLEYQQVTDLNGNGMIDNGEPSTTQEFCDTDSQTYISETRSLPIGSADCPDAGGTQIDIGFDNGNGRLSSIVRRDENILQTGQGLTFNQLITTYYNTCVRLSNGEHRCWGDEDYAINGDPSDNDWGDDQGELVATAPQPDMGSGRTVVEFAGRGYQMCALLDNHDVKCWGYSEYGELGRTQFYEEEVGDSEGEMGDNLPAVEIY